MKKKRNKRRRSNELKWWLTAMQKLRTMKQNKMKLNLHKSTVEELLQTSSRRIFDRWATYQPQHRCCNEPVGVFLLIMFCHKYVGD